MQEKVKVGFICVHNSCRSQIAEALAKHYGSDLMEAYSAGTETKDQINQDAVRLVKEKYGIDMEKDQFSKLIDDIPQIDIKITMGCDVICPFVESKYEEDWDLDDPTGQSDEVFLETIEEIDRKIHQLMERIENGEFDE